MDTNDTVVRRSHNFINMSGFKVGRLYVTSEFEIRKELNGKKKEKSRPYWKCKCNCGNTCYVNARRLRLGQTKSCGCLKMEDSAKKALSMILPNNQASKNDVFRTYNWNASKRNINFNLSYEHFENITSRLCNYCGSEPSNRKGDFIYNGIDRLDNTKGYEPDNCVPCCKVCNRAKDTMTEQEFLDWVRRVFNHASRKTERVV